MFGNILDLLVPLQTETLKAVNTVCGLEIAGDGTVTKSQ